MCTRDLIAACEAYWNVKPHLGKVGGIYTHLKPNDDVIAQLPQLPQNVDADYMDLKVGETSDLPARMQGYAQECVGVPLIWAYHYPTVHSRLLGKGIRCISYSLPKKYRTFGSSHAARPRRPPLAESLQRLPPSAPRIFF
jgi:hypothetical protein